MNRSRGEHLIRRLVVVPAVLALTLSGCGAFSGSGDDDGGTGGETLTYWSMWQRGEPQSRVLQSAIDAFEEESGARVDVQWAGREVGKKVRAAANSDRVPDLTDNSAEELLAGSAADLYSGLSDVYAERIPGEDVTVGEVIPETYVAPYEVASGEPIIAPYEVLSMAIWYDGAKLPEVAANPPRTWDEFVALLRRMKADGQTPIAADGTIPDYNAYWLYQLVERHLGPGWLRRAALDRTGRSWADPKFLAAAKRLEEIVGAGYFMDGYEGSKLPAGEQSWAKGDANFLMMGSWAPSATAPAARDGIVYRSFPMPAVEDSVATEELSLIGFGIPTRGDNPELAARFIAFFMNRRWLSRIASEADNLTPRADVAAPEPLADLKVQLEEAEEANRYLDGLPATAEQFHKGVFLPLDDKLFFGDITAEQFVEQLQKQSADFWKRNG